MQDKDVVASEPAREPEPKICEPGGRGLFFPLVEAEQGWPSHARAVIYMLALLYLFLGVSIVSDRFVSSIEVITSRKKRVRHKRTGQIVTVAIWNGTVANLTLMALGSSAPEILLSVVEIMAGGFHSGDLGPSTIVGSAAFNLFMIIAVCIMAVPSSGRKIKENGVFAVTAIFSVFAYIWLVVICQVISPDVIELWEGLMTLGFLPVLILVSYLADVGYFSLGGRRPQEMQIQRRQVEVGGRVAALPDDAVWEQMGEEQWSNELRSNGLDALDGQRLHHGGTAAESRHSASSLPENSAGVLVFPSETWDVKAGFEEKDVKVMVLRKSGAEGPVSCRFRTEGRTAVPGYDFVDANGTLDFGPGEEKQELWVKLLPKRLGEHSDEFQIVLEDIHGGAIFDPCSDGGEEQCVLTVTIHNKNDRLIGSNVTLRVMRWFDGLVNMDSQRFAALSWWEDIKGSICEVGDVDEEGKRSALDWVLHVVSAPWKLAFAILVPPTSLGGGWCCFVASLVMIGGVTTWVIDFAELFGCVAQLENSITAITFVALGTSMPDLFASKTAACQDEWADASIVNVTGSNSVNVFLGIGLPWTMAAVYWAAQGATEEWKLRYGEHVEAWPGGAFVVRTGDLVFSVVVFTLSAAIALLLIRLRRAKLGAELGGPFMAKALSSLLLCLLWAFYLGLSIWKVKAKDADFSEQAAAIAIAVGVVENVMLVLGMTIMVLFTKGVASDNQKYSDLEAAAAAADAEETGGLEEEGSRFRGWSAAETGGLSWGGGASRNAAKPPPLGTMPRFHQEATTMSMVPTTYGLQFGEDDALHPKINIRFTSAVMVVLAAQRFKSLDRRFQTSQEVPGWMQQLQQRQQMHQQMQQQQGAIRRESSFHSVHSEEECSACLSGSRPHIHHQHQQHLRDSRGHHDLRAAATGTAAAEVEQVPSMRGRVAGYVRGHATDWAALSIAGLAAAPFVG